MNITKKFVQIKKVLPNIIGEEKSDKYLKDLNFVYIGSQDIYENALNHLMNGETDRSLKFMIFGLDIDRNYAPLLNLCRTMLFGLSDILRAGDIDIYRSKYKNFENARISLIHKISDLKIKVADFEERISSIEEVIEESKPQFFSPKKLYIMYKLISRKLEPSKQEYVNEKKNTEIVIKSLEKEVAQIDRIISIEDSMQVLKIIVEICTIPVKYEWAID